MLHLRFAAPRLCQLSVPSFEIRREGDLQCGPGPAEGPRGQSVAREALTSIRCDVCGCARGGRPARRTRAKPDRSAAAGDFDSDATGKWGVPRQIWKAADDCFRSGLAALERFPARSAVAARKKNIK